MPPTHVAGARGTRCPGAPSAGQGAMGPRGRAREGRGTGAQGLWPPGWLCEGQGGGGGSEGQAGLSPCWSPRLRPPPRQCPYTRSLSAWTQFTSPAWVGVEAAGRGGGQRRPSRALLEEASTARFSAVTVGEASAVSLLGRLPGERGTRVFPNGRFFVPGPLGGGQHGGGHLTRNQSFGVKSELRHQRPPVSESIHSFMHSRMHSFIHSYI